MHAPLLNVLTPSVEVSGADGSFRVAPSRPVNTPFESETCSTGRETVAVEAWRNAMERGGKPVVIQYPGMDQPLFGLLMLCAIDSSAGGPWQREYLLQIPASYVEQTDQSRMSVVYEIYPPGAQARGYAWILWLSRLPVFTSAAAVPAASEWGMGVVGGGVGGAVSGGVAPAPAPVPVVVGPQPEGAQGELLIATTPPGATVTVDGAAAGKATLRLKLLNGEHFIEVRWPDGKTRSAVGVVKPGQSSVVHLQAP